MVRPGPRANFTTRRILVDVRVVHAERLENVLGGKRTERLAAQPPHDFGQKQVTRVAVLVIGAWREIEPSLARDECDEGSIRIAAVGHRGGQLAQQEHVAQAAGVGQQVTDRQPAIIGQLGNVASRVVVEGQLAAFRQQHDAHGGELFRDRRDVKDGRRGDRNP